MLNKERETEIGLNVKSNSSAIKEKTIMQMYPVKKMPMETQKFEEIFSENPKETPPLFYDYDANPNIPVYAEHNTHFSQKSPSDGNEFSYHPFYMQTPSSSEPSAGNSIDPSIQSATTVVDEEVSTVPPPKCPTVDMHGPIVVPLMKSASSSWTRKNVKKTTR